MLLTYFNVYCFSRSIQQLKKKNRVTDSLNVNEKISSEPNPKTEILKKNKEEIRYPIDTNESNWFKIKMDNGKSLNVNIGLKTNDLFEQIKNYVDAFILNYKKLYDFDTVSKIISKYIKRFDSVKMILNILEQKNLTSENDNLPVEARLCIVDMEIIIEKYEVIQKELKETNEIFSQKYDQEILKYFEYANCFNAFQKLFDMKFVEYKLGIKEFDDPLKIFENALVRAKNQDDKNIFKYFICITKELSELFNKHKEISVIKTRYINLKHQLKKCLKYNKKFDEKIKKLGKLTSK